VDSDFERFRCRVEDIIALNDREGARRSATVLLDAFEKLYDGGTPAFDLAHTAFLLSHIAASTFGSLEANLAFGEMLKEAGANKIRSVSTNWPPVDPEQWPENTPDWLTKA
jgi:hypothetical protein